MNLLTAIMPGVRQLRTPLASGALWLAVAYLAVWPHWNLLTTQFSALGPLLANVTGVETIYQIGALAFIAYLVGSVAQGVSTGFAELATKAARVVELRIEHSKVRLLKRWRYRLGSRRDQYPVRSVVMDAISQKYSSAGYPSNAYLSFPVSLIENQLEAMSLQIWQKAPDQYQESDRLRGESDFRIGVALPILILGIQLGLLITWVLTPFVAVGALVLALQSRRFKWERKALLANAFNQELATSATLDGTVRVLSDMRLPARMSFVMWFQATGIALARAGSIDGFEMALNDGAIEISDEVDFGSGGWESGIDLVIERIMPIYENSDVEDGWELFLNNVDRRRAAAREAVREYAQDGGRDLERADRIGRVAWRRAHRFAFAG